MSQEFILIIFAVVGFALIGGIAYASNHGSLDSIKSKPVGDGQHGTARWAEPKEIAKTFARVPFHPAQWRQGKDLPKVQGLVLGSQGNPFPQQGSLSMAQHCNCSGRNEYILNPETSVLHPFGCQTPETTDHKKLRFP